LTGHQPSLSLEIDVEVIPLLPLFSGGARMMDILFIRLAVAFFGLSWALVKLRERL
jgi:hypothetical protein